MISGKKGFKDSRVQGFKWQVAVNSNFAFRLSPRAFSLSNFTTYKLGTNAVKKNHSFSCEGAPVIADKYKSLFS
ncbi:MAG: hypothetical protein QG578_1382 [Thermodesulfobacteriota bacterium]|nr:hypothetical protein [Thermodesulfobacteriota bacterium]